MSFPRRTIQIPMRGVVADLPSWNVPDQFLTAAQNVVFRNDIAERIKGERSAYATIQTDILGIINVLVGTDNYWLYHGSDESYVVLGSTHSDVTIAGGLTSVAAAHQWSQCLLNGVPVANNALDVPMYWAGNPASPMVALPDWPAGSTCESIVAHRYHLFALGLHESGGEFPSKVMWSAAAAPGSVPAAWTPAASNDAGSTELAEGKPIIQTGKTLRGSLLVYANGSVWAIDWVGGQNKYEPRPLFSNFGALTKRAVDDINGRHFVVGDGDCFVTDGVGEQSVGRRKMRNYIFDNLDQDNYAMLFTQYNRARQEIWVCFPTAGNDFCDLAAVYDVRGNEWGNRELPLVSCAATGIVSDTAPSQIIDDQTDIIDSVTTSIDALNYTLAADSLVVGVPGTPELIQVDTLDTTARDSFVKRHDLTLGSPERVKLVRRLHLSAKNYQTLYVRVGSRMRPDDAITWSSEVTLTSPESVVDAFACGRFISFEIRSDDSAHWILGPVGLETEFRGYA